MKIRAITILFLAAITVGFTSAADLVDFGTTTKPNTEGSGFRVTGVFQGTPAAKLGITEGDIVTKLDGNQLQTTAPLARLIAGVREPNSEVTIDWTRKGEAMTGKATLSSTLSKEDFDERYSNNKFTSRIQRPPVPMILGGNLDDLDLDKQLGGLKDLGIELEEIEKQLKDALSGTGMSHLMRNASTSFSVMKVATSPNGSKVTVKGSGDKKHDVKIEKDGEVIFNEKISEEELDKVPAEEREFVKGLMGNKMGVVIRNIGRGGDPKKDVEDSVSDLLKKVEEGKKD